LYSFNITEARTSDLSRHGNVIAAGTHLNEKSCSR